MLVSCRFEWPSLSRTIDPLLDTLSAGRRTVTEHSLTRFRFAESQHLVHYRIGVGARNLFGLSETACHQQLGSQTTQVGDATDKASLVLPGDDCCCFDMADGEFLGRRFRVGVEQIGHRANTYIGQPAGSLGTDRRSILNSALELQIKPPFTRRARPLASPPGMAQGLRAAGS